MKVISWNLARKVDAWRQLVDSEADVALVQEAAQPPDDVAGRIQVDAEPWATAGAARSRPWRAAVVGLAPSVRIRWLRPRSIADAEAGDLPVSRLGTVSAAVVNTVSGGPVTLVSMYGAWESPHPEADSPWIYADASVHRVISDLSALVGRQRGHHILAAGDLNILHRYGEDGSAYWAGRYATVFARMEAIGLPLVGPQSPNGRPAEPWPAELPSDSANVPTYHTSSMTPATAQRQMDFVFASTALAGRVRVRALNQPEEWGPSDHCRMEIEIEE